MKKLLLLPAALLSSALCLAQDVGRVLSSSPIIQQVAVPRQVCTMEQVAVQSPKSGAGAVIGAIAGGAMGNAIGGGSGKAAATMLGIIGGAVVGDRVEGTPRSQYSDVQRCTTQTFYENRTVAYTVIYEYAGKQYSVQMPRDPGPTILLQIAPLESVGPARAPISSVTYPPSGYDTQTSVVVVPPVVYPPYYGQPAYPPIRVETEYWGDGHRGRYRH